MMLMRNIPQKYRIIPTYFQSNVLGNLTKQWCVKQQTTYSKYVVFVEAVDGL